MTKKISEGLKAVFAEAAKRAPDTASLDVLSEGGLEDLLARYYRHEATSELLSANPTDLIGAVLNHIELAGQRLPGKPTVRVDNPTLESNGWQTSHTVAEIVMDDVPFLVDSITAELSRQNRAIHLVIHPTVLVRRDDQGNLLEVLNVDAAYQASEGPDSNWPQDALVESWMHVEIDRVTDKGDLADIRENLVRVLHDVYAAVRDWRDMRSMAKELSDSVVANIPQDLAAEAGEAQRLLSWLCDDHFTFLGYRKYKITGDEGDRHLAVVEDSGLGILSRREQDESVSFARLSPPVRAQAMDRAVLILTKANSRATVHRTAYLDYVGVKTFDANGNVDGEHRFLGLLTSATYTQSVRKIPVIDTKVQEVFDRAGFAKGSHSAKDLNMLLETYPRDELLQMSTDELYDTAMSVMHLQERRQTRVFTRRDRYGRFVSCLVFLPRDRYTTEVRERMMDILSKFLDATEVDYSTRLSESVLARLHFVARTEKGTMIPEDFDREGLGAALVAATRSWEEDLHAALVAELGEEEAGRVSSKWREFPSSYKEEYEPRLAVTDLRRLERLTTEEEAVNNPAAAAAGTPVAGMVVNMYQPLGSATNSRRFKIYRKEPLTLSAVLPIFRHLGVEVIDERPYELKSHDGTAAYLYDFGLESKPELLEDANDRFTEAFAAAWMGAAESDGLDRLVLGAHLSWREVVILRAYAKYLRQAGTPFSQNYIERVLMENAKITRLLVEMFEARFDPDFDGDKDARHDKQAELDAEIRAQLEGVASLDADRILRLFLDLITNTVRTNFYQRDENGQYKSYSSFKLLPQQLLELPEPRPAYEIWVYSPRVEGVHLRFGKVARGGLRWSDRREDFRTEVLGLVKAQMVKNAVIIPTGSKGGFFAKNLPDPSEDRDAWLTEGKACYKTFISALLDVTDNYGQRLDDGTREIIPPTNVIRHDADDPYLVVAADKGTATFSDLANGVAIDYGFWLGDAFASGGSVGYDHKEMGITARGAWESVKRHFREMGHDTQTEDFTVIGIGDMSGDVFGNGMLLSEHIRLVAAFNHMHIFIDPNPDAASSFEERKRLFHSERGTWDKYDTSKISEGGGVFERSAKSIALNDQIREALGIEDTVTQLTPTELIARILRAEVDLLWNGGIGTYVKASSESHLQVGDRANDAIRLNGDELQVRVVGEGGNLGCTQLGRIEAALSGVRLNTDAIDNSAGVSSSDHEVNIKIMLEQAVTDGDLTMKQRNELLASMTDEVVDLVLRDNVEQNILLSNARHQSDWMLGTHERFIKFLEKSGELDRELEFLPSEKEIQNREEAGIGLTSPELSVLVAYSKMHLEHHLLETDIPEEPWFHELLDTYFPQKLQEEFGDRYQEHPLAREIIVTVIANELVNRGGITYAYRAFEETGADTAAITRAFAISRSVFGLHDYTDKVDNLDMDVPTATQTRMYLEFRRLLDRAARWYLNNRVDQLDVATEIERVRPLVEKYRGRMNELLVGTELDRLQERMDQMTVNNVPEDVALWEAGLLDSYSLLDINVLVEHFDVDAEYVVVLYFTLSERYHIDALLEMVSALPRDSRWRSLARGAVRDDLYVVLESLTEAVLGLAPLADLGSASGDIEQTRGEVTEWIEQWEERNDSQISRLRSTLADVHEMDDVDLATLSVVLRQMRGVTKAAAPSQS